MSNAIKEQAYYHLSAMETNTEENEYRHFALAFALAMAFCGGLTELYSARIRGTYAAMMTGNTISMFIAFADGQDRAGWFGLAVIATFFLTCLFAEVALLVAKRKRLELHPWLLLLQALCFLPALLVPINQTVKGYLYIREATGLDLLANCFLAVYGAIQLVAFIDLQGTAYPTTMMTKNTKTAIAELVTGLADRSKSRLARSLALFAVIAFFFMGVVSFYLALSLGPAGIARFVPLVPLAITLVLFAFSFKAYHRKPTAASLTQANKAPRP